MMKRKTGNCKFVWLVINFFIITGTLHAQDSGVYLIPQRIFVGDHAALVLSLPAAEQNSADIILTGENLPAEEHIDFHRIILEQRISGSRLLIEFTAFLPGTLELPVIVIAGESFSGLSVTVSSVIDDRSDHILSGTASTLAMPGTAFMLYGFMAAIVFILLLTIWFAVKGRTLLRELKEKWKRSRLFAGIRKTEKRLHKAILKRTDKRIILDKLSQEFRNFLSVFTGSNCRAMTAREFKALSLNVFFNDENLSLENFFNRCDELRFSGANIDSQDIMQLLNNMRQFVDALEKIKGKQTEEKAA